MKGRNWLPACLPLGPGLRLGEIGAGRGGKTTHLGEAMGNTGLLVAVDRHHRRLQEMALTTRRWGVTIAHPVRANAAQALPLKTAALDAVVLDAPCSCLGIIRRHPEIKSRLREDDLATFPPRQQAMLEAAARLLKPGGRLLYITCTTEPAENEGQINSFPGPAPGISPGHRPRAAAAAGPAPDPPSRLVPHLPGGPQPGRLFRRRAGQKLSPGVKPPSGGEVVPRNK